MMYFIFTFFVGAAVGSFVNVLIDRTMANQDWVSGRSRCDHCHKTLSWYDMIPLVSYAIYRGKSRCCHTPLSYRYPIVEILVGVLFVWWLGVGFWFFQLVNAPLSVIQPAFWLVTGIVLAILALADLFYGVVLLGVVWFGSITVVLYRLTLLIFGAYQVSDLVMAIVTALGFYVLFYALYRLTKGKGMADGDMYVAMYMGLLLGWPRGGIALLASFVLGACVGLGLIVSGIRSRKDTLPFVPFMVGAITLALLFSEEIIRYVS